MRKSIATLGDLEAEALHFAGTLAPRANGATLVALSGELGAGKTAFVKALARVFGIKETVTSPTFVLEKIYLLPEGKPFKRLIHIDAYRLESGKDLSPLGFDEFVQDASSLILLEWPERVADTLPPATIRVSLSAGESGSRTIAYE